MLNSRNYQSDAQVINSGEQIAPEADLKNPNTKVYFHRIPGAKTHLPDGAEIQFLGGQFATANPEIIVHLDKIADKKGTQVFTVKSDTLVADLAVAATDAATPAGDAALVISGQKPQTASEEMIAKVTQKPEAPEILPGQDASARIAALKSGAGTK